MRYTNVGLPRLGYHLTAAENWSSIQERGLLSAGQLIELTGAALSLRRVHRPRRLTLAPGIVLNDQAPMPPVALDRCLRDMTPPEWYELLNGKVFFWLDRGRVARLRQAARATAQVLLAIDVGLLLARHHSKAAVTPFNTGFAGRRPSIRGRATFVPLELWLASAWATEGVALSRRARSRTQVPAELVVEGGVPDIRDLIRDVVRLPSGELLEFLDRGKWGQISNRSSDHERSIR